MATKAKSGAASGAASSKKFGGKTYKKVSCHTTATAAKSKAKTIRTGGGTARVLGKCVYQGPKAKTRRRRAA